MTNHILAFTLLLVAGCTTASKFAPLDEQTNPLTLNLLKTTVRVREDKIVKQTAYDFLRANDSLYAPGGHFYHFPIIVENTSQVSPRGIIRMDASDWIFFQRVDYFCESTGKKITKIADHPMREVGHGISTVTEQFEYVSSKADYEFLASCSDLTIRLTGPNHYREFKQSKNQQDAFREAILLLGDLKGKRAFKAMSSDKTP